MSLRRKSTALTLAFTGGVAWDRALLATPALSAEEIGCALIALALLCVAAVVLRYFDAPRGDML